jgi:hypothetical protein
MLQSYPPQSQGEGLKFGVYFNDMSPVALCPRVWHLRISCLCGCLSAVHVCWGLTSERALSSNIPDCRSAANPKFFFGGGLGLLSSSLLLIVRGSVGKRF